MLRPRARDTASPVLQRVARGRPRSGHRRVDAHQHTGRERNRRGRPQYRQRDRYVAVERQVGRAERGQDIETQARDAEACDGAERAEHQALEEEEPHDPRAPGTERRPQRDLAPASGESRGQQVRDVAARDEQHERDRG
jgi:hypothetical protein